MKKLLLIASLFLTACNNSNATITTGTAIPPLKTIIPFTPSPLTTISAFKSTPTSGNSNENELILKKTFDIYGSFFALSPDGRIIASSNADKIYTIDALNGDLAAEFLKPEASFMGQGPVVFSPDGKTLAAEVNIEGANGTKSEIYLLDSATFNLIRKFDYDRLLVDIHFSPDGKLIAGTGESGSVYVWDIKDGKETHLNSYANYFAFSPVDSLLASGELVGLSGPAVILWNTKDFTSKGIFDLEPNLNSAYSGLTTSVSFSPDGHLLAAVINGKLRFWDVAANKEIKSPFTTSESLVKAIYSNKGYLATLNQKGEITVYDSNSGNVLGTKVVKNVDDPIYFETAFAMMFSPDGKQLLTGAYDIPIQVWEIP